MTLQHLSFLISWATIAVSLANVLILWWSRRRIYHTGWIDGRIDLLQHMQYAATNGVPFDTFVRQVAARDGMLLPGDLPRREQQNDG